MPHNAVTRIPLVQLYGTVSKLHTEDKYSTKHAVTKMLVLQLYGTESKSHTEATYITKHAVTWMFVLQLYGTAPTAHTQVKYMPKGDCDFDTCMALARHSIHAIVSFSITGLSVRLGYVYGNSTAQYPSHARKSSTSQRIPADPPFLAARAFVPIYMIL